VNNEVHALYFAGENCCSGIWPSLQNASGLF